MHIAILQHTFNPTTLGWVRGLEARGHTVTTIVSHTKEPQGGWDEDLHVIVVPSDVRWARRIGRRLLPGRKAAVYALPRARVLRAVLREQRVDAVLVKVYSLRNVLASVLALTLRLRRLGWIEQAPPIGIEWRLLRAIGVLPRVLFTALDARPGGIAVPSDPPAGGLPVVTYAPVIPDRVPSVPDSPRVRLLHVGAFWDEAVKRQVWTLRAAAAAGLTDGACTLTFVGLGRSDSPALLHLQGTLSELGLEGSVRIELNVAHRDMSSRFAQHDILLLWSAQEQFGMVVPEAMAHGLAVIATDVVGALGCIVPERTGLLVPVADERAFQAAVRRLVDDPALAARMGAAGREFIETHAAPAVTAEAIERLLSGSRGRAGALRHR